MLDIKDIIGVYINREVSSISTSDLKTVAILSKHSHFPVGEFYREYTSLKELIEDGFTESDFAYQAAQRIFSQPRAVSKIVVGMVQSTEQVDYVTEVSNFKTNSSEWFYLITDATAAEDKVAISEYVETQTMFYVFSDSNPSALDPETQEDVFSVLRDKGVINSCGMYLKDKEVVAPEAAWVGKFATSELGSSVWIHKPLPTLAPEKFSRRELDALLKKNAHFYTSVDEYSSIEGSGNVLGGEKVHVVLGLLWLKTRLSERVWSVLFNSEHIAYTNEDIEVFKTEIVGVLNEAVNRGIISSEQRFTVQMPDVSNFSSQERESGVLKDIKFRARLAGAILFVDSILGTVEVGDGELVEWSDSYVPVDSSDDDWGYQNSKEPEKALWRILRRSHDFESGDRSEDTESFETTDTLTQDATYPHGYMTATTEISVGDTLRIYAPDSAKNTNLEFDTDGWWISADLADSSDDLELAGGRSEHYLTTEVMFSLMFSPTSENPLRLNEASRLENETLPSEYVDIKLLDDGTLEYKFPKSWVFTDEQALTEQINSSVYVKDKTARVVVQSFLIDVKVEIIRAESGSGNGSGNSNGDVCTTTSWTYEGSYNVPTISPQTIVSQYLVSDVYVDDVYSGFYVHMSSPEEIDAASLDPEYRKELASKSFSSEFSYGAALSMASQNLSPNHPNFLLYVNSSADDPDRSETVLEGLSENNLDNFSGHGRGMGTGEDGCLSYEDYSAEIRITSPSQATRKLFSSYLRVQDTSGIVLSSVDMFNGGEDIILNSCTRAVAQITPAGSGRDNYTAMFKGAEDIPWADQIEHKKLCQKLDTPPSYDSLPDVPDKWVYDGYISDYFSTPDLGGGLLIGADVLVDGEYAGFMLKAGIHNELVQARQDITVANYLAASAFSSEMAWNWAASNVDVNSPHAKFPDFLTRLKFPFEDGLGTQNAVEITGLIENNVSGLEGQMLSTLAQNSNGCLEFAKKPSVIRITGSMSDRTKNYLKDTGVYDTYTTGDFQYLTDVFNRGEDIVITSYLIGTPSSMVLQELKTAFPNENFSIDPSIPRHTVCP